MEVYFNPKRMEYVGDLLMQAMGRANKAAHSFNQIVNEALAIGYSDYDGDFAVMTQALEQLTDLYRRHYDFVQDSIGQYACADHANIGLLGDIGVEFARQLQKSATVGPAAFRLAEADAVRTLSFEEPRANALLPVNLSAYMSISAADIRPSGEVRSAVRTLGMMRQTQAFLFERTGHTAASAETGSPLVIEAAALPPRHAPGLDVPVKASPLDLAGLLIPGTLLAVIARSGTLSETQNLPDQIKNIFPVLPETDSLIPTLSLKGIKGDTVHVRQEQPQKPAGHQEITREQDPAPLSGRARTVIFKTISDFFIYLEKIAFLLREERLQPPLMAPLATYSIQPLDFIRTGTQHTQFGEVSFKSSKYEDVPRDKDAAASVSAGDARAVHFKTIDDYFIYLDKIASLLREEGLRRPPVASLRMLSTQPLDFIRTKTQLDAVPVLNLNGMTGDTFRFQKRSLSASFEDSEATRNRNTSAAASAGDARAVHFKTIDDYFISLDKIAFLLREEGLQPPPVTSLGMLSIHAPDLQHEHVNPWPDTVTGDYEVLEKILFARQETVVQEVTVRDMQDYDHILPYRFASARFNSFYAPLQDLDHKAVDYLSATAGDYRSMEPFRYEMVSQPDENEGIRETTYTKFQSIQQMVHDNMDPEMTLPVVDVKPYRDINDTGHKVIKAVILPGLRLTDDTYVAPLAPVNRDSRPVIPQTSVLSEQSIDAMTIIDDEGLTAQIPHVNILGYDSMFDRASLRLNLKGGDYESLNHLLFATDEAAEISEATGGLYTAVMASDEDSAREDVYVPQRARSAYLDVTTLEWADRQTVLPEVVTTDYAQINAVNKLNVVEQAMRAGNIRTYAAKYENGVAGMSADLVQTYRMANMTMKDMDIWVQNLSDVLSMHIKDSYQDMEEKQEKREPESQVNTPAQVYQTDDMEADLPLYSYIPQIVTVSKGDYEDITLQQYDEVEKTALYRPDTQIAGDLEGVTIHQYQMDVAQVALQVYVPDETVSSIRDNEGDALTTHISEHAEADIQLSIKKRLELWLKWLFEMSMKPFSGANDAEELLVTLRQLKQTVTDEPVIHDVTQKSIKRFVENLETVINPDVPENIL